MKESSPKPDIARQPDWDRIERDVTRKLRFLRLAWEASEERRDFSTLIKRDILIPALLLLAEFCACVEEEPDK